MNIIKLFKNKGWGLYEVNENTSGDLAKIVNKGRIQKFESNKYYTILPFVSNGESTNEVFQHLNIAQKTNQAPKYKSGKQIIILDGLEYVDDILYLHPSNTTSFLIKVNKNNIERSIQYGISNYNIFSFSSIEELLKVISIPSQQEPILPKQLRWELAHKDDSDCFILYPSEPNPIFFRGQNSRYQPCYPSISRNIKTRSPILNKLTLNEQMLVVIRLIKSEWFCSILEETPQFKWCKENKLWMDKMALAQHYELPTGLIDLTQSIEVAAFFACCKYNIENGSWSAMTTGEGIIYSLDYRLVPVNTRKVRAIGQQVFPRPSEQWAWTFEMNLNEDFDLLPFVKKFVFQHNEEMSEKILNKFSCGKDLFPHDPLFSLAQKVKKCKELPRHIVNSVLDDLLTDEQGLRGESKLDLIKKISENFTIKDEVPVLNKEIMKDLEKTWNDKKDDFMNNLGRGFRPIRSLK